MNVTNAVKAVDDPTLVYGTTVNYTCHMGYNQTHGDDKQTCQTDGTWSGQIPTCQGVYCYYLIFCFELFECFYYSLTLV